MSLGRLVYTFVGCKLHDMNLIIIHVIFLSSLIVIRVYVVIVDEVIVL